MKTIEERAKQYVPNVIDPNYVELPARGGGFFLRALRDAYIAGAKEQKAINEEVRLKKCDDMTEEEYEREVAFADWYNKNGKGTPTYSDAIEWARKEAIDKACSILEDMTEGKLGKRFISEFKNKLKYGVLERH